MNLQDQFQQEAFDALIQGNGSAVLPMRSGKTLVGLRLASKFERPLVGYPNKPILQSWLDDSKKFNIPIDHITFTTYKSLEKHKLKEHDILILDEVDCVSQKNWMYIAINRPNRVNGLTATPPTGGTKRVYYRMITPTVYERNIDETAGIINKDYDILVHLIEPSKKRTISTRNGGMISESDLIRFLEGKFDKKIEEEGQNDFQLLLSIIRKISHSPSKFTYLKNLINIHDERALVFASTKEQCNGLGDYTYYTGNPDSAENLRKFQENEIKRLISVNQLKAGVTFPNVRTAYILHAFSSHSQAPQKIGRILNRLGTDRAIAHIMCLKGTKDEAWVRKAMNYFNDEKVHYIDTSHR